MISRRGGAAPVLMLVLLMFAVALGWVARERQQAVAAQQEAIPPARVLVRTGAVPRAVRESSGVAVSRTHPGVLWTHNDSGGDAELFAIDLAGEVLGRVELDGAGARDWEDIALGPCPASWEEPASCLYVADTGDNAGVRRDVTLYVLPEPAPDAREVKPRAELDFTYDTGPDDAEAVAVTAEGDLIVVTKGRHGHVTLYELGHEALDEALGQKGRVTLGPGQRLPIEPDRRLQRLVTGAAISAGGRLAVRTYPEVYFFDRTDAGWTLAGACSFWNRNMTGEAIDFLDEHQMVVTGEWVRSRPGDIFRVRCDAEDGGQER
ncbi:MAG: hypothetical protein R3E98_20520 [Gemmatimonadota bacterium]